MKIKKGGARQLVKSTALASETILRALRTDKPMPLGNAGEIGTGRKCYRDLLDSGCSVNPGIQEGMD